VYSYQLAAALLLTLAGVFELVDAASAKFAWDGRVGVFVDFVADRVSDFAIFGSIAFAFRSSNHWIMYASAATLVVSFLGSYVRAQADALRLPPSPAHVGRAERMIAVMVGFWVELFWHPQALELALSFALIVSLISLVERFIFAVIHPSGSGALVPPPFSWAPDEFLPRLCEQLGETVEQVERDVLLVCKLDSAIIDSWETVGVVRQDESGLPQVTYFDNSLPLGDSRQPPT
jgi:phosphatidylglycerophosphate synthase